MNADERRYKLNGICEKIIGSAFDVSNTLGCGFLEKVYENALAHELRKTGLKVETQCSIKVYYDRIVVGEFIADMIVEECILVEIKAIRTLGERETAQCLNYLKATYLSICLLINFGNPRVEHKRIVQNF